MCRKLLVIALMAAALLSVSCDVVGLPVKRVETGPTITEDIKVPLPGGGGVVNLEITVGFGELSIKGGAEDALVKGTATYNVKEFKPVIIISGNDVRLRQGESKFEVTIPDLDKGVKNKWDLELSTVPMSLTINAGAATAKIELGGLSLEGLNVSQGASDFDLSFSDANKAEMNALRFNAGAANAKLTSLANANAQEIVFKGGVGNYTLEFSGALQRNLRVILEAGVGQVVVIVPEGVAAEATIEGGLTNVDVRDAWQRSGNKYILAGEGPAITFEFKMGAGNLSLRNR
ncbi:MAG: toast rack family protein [Anaerolineae bacterium]|jgi:hypothetical protein|nr:toast rack family protein [Anaerolineae bacterium]MDH7472848.1 toast rack family protein [Anaerolineae bacterium]